MPADRDLTDRAPAGALRGLSRRAGLAGFLRWWTGELATFVPRTARAAVKRRRLRPVMAFDAVHAVLWRPAAGEHGIEMQPVVTIPLSGDAAAGRAALDSVPRVIYGGASAPARVAVALPSKSVLRRSLVLPAAVEENLLDTLAFDLDRHTPFKADELYFDAEVIGRDAARGEIRVDLAAARRGIVDRIVAQTESWGATVVAVTPDGASTTEPSRLNLLATEKRPSPGAGAWLRIWAPLALLLALCAVAVALPVWQKREYAIALLRIVDEVRGQAAVSDGLRTQLERETAEYNFPLERKFAFPSSLQVLDEITKLLPDDTWLTQMEVKTQTRGKDTQRELLLRGESANAGRLITLFEESKVFTQAAPRSPTTKIQPGPGEIFDLAAQLRPLPKPEPIALAASPATVAPEGGGAGSTPQTAVASPSSPTPAVAPAATTPAPTTPAQTTPAQTAPTVPAAPPAPAAEASSTGPAGKATPPAPAPSALPLPAPPTGARPVSTPNAVAPDQAGPRGSEPPRVQP
jgi:general secretion pathway protein L